MSSSDHNAGYGKPPKKSQFKSGQSGNPKGRPKGSRNLSTDLSDELSEKLMITEGGKSRRITKQRAMIKTLLAKTLKGDVRSANALLRLIPGAELAQKSVAEAETLSLGDQEILKAYRDQISEELNQTPTGDVS